MSSWFDAKQFTSLAKNALTEAQKTLDKALDIKEDGNQVKALNADRPAEEEDDDNDDAASVASSASSAAAAAIANSKLWGSFTGSFFDASQIRSQNKQEDKQGPSSVVISSPPSIKSPFSSPRDGPVKSPRELEEVEPVSSMASSVHSSSAVMEEVDEDHFQDMQIGQQLQQDKTESTQSKEEVNDSKQVEEKDGFCTSQLITAAASPTEEKDITIENLQNEDDESEPGCDEKEKTPVAQVEEEEAKDQQRPQQPNSGLAVTASNDDLSSSMSSGHTIAASEPAANPTESSTASSTNVLGALDKEEGGKVSEKENDDDDGGSQGSSSGSGGVSRQLDEAMVEQEKRSETSSSKSYEVVAKSPTSGATSGDELETNTTSSDIEVISNPSATAPSPIAGLATSRRVGGRNGNHSIMSAAGHARTNSEISAAMSDAETDRLHRKVAELTELLEARESKLVEMSRSSHELQEQNSDLASRVKEAMRVHAKLAEAAQSSEEATGRLADMEKKLQKALAENERLKSENKALKHDSSSRLSHQEVDETIREKDEVIDDLRHEGEKLSKQVGKHSEIIKKLRSKEKATDKELKTLRSDLEEARAECDRVKKSLAAKDEVETRQIEAIQTLTSANSRWEEEHNKTVSDLEDSTEKIASLKTSLESAYREIAELKRGLVEKEGEAQEMALNKEMEAKQQLQDQLRHLQERTTREKDALYLQIEELRGALSAGERSATRREEQLRRERDDLLARLEQSENRHEELSGSVSAATRPLLRQIESLQASLNETQGASERVERSLAERLQQATIQLAAAQERERTAAEQYVVASSKTASLESKLTALQKDKAALEAKLESEESKRSAAETEVSRASSAAERARDETARELVEARKEKDFALTAAAAERAEAAAERRKALSLAEQLKDRDRRIKEIQQELDMVRTAAVAAGGHPRVSPTPSQLSQFSVNGSAADHFTWPDEVFESASVRAGSTSLYDSVRQGGSTAALIESYQAQLKQRDGEVVQLQTELAQAERSRLETQAEVARLAAGASRAEHLAEEVGQLRTGFTALEQKYQTMLTMYGEKVEEAEELRLDLADVKEMYKTQIEELVRKGGGGDGQERK